MATIPEQYADLFSKRAFGVLATLMPDGRPQATPVWCDYDGTFVLVNTVEGRVKERNMRRDPRVALTILDPDNPYRYLEIRGRATELTREGAEAHIDRLAKKYLDQDRYPFRRPGEVRVICKLRPERVRGNG